MVSPIPRINPNTFYNGRAKNNILLKYYVNLTENTNIIKHYSISLNYKIKTNITTVTFRLSLPKSLFVQLKAIKCRRALIKRNQTQLTFFFAANKQHI